MYWRVAPVRLEPLDQRHAGRLVAAAAAVPSLYQWSAVPQGKHEMTRYIDTALAWRDAGTAEPFAIVRRYDGALTGSMRFIDMEPLGMAGGPPASRQQRARHLRDRLIRGWPVRPTDRSQHRGQAPDAGTSLRNLANAPRLPSHG